MKPTYILQRDDARRIARHFGMTDFEPICSPVAATEQTRRYSRQSSSIVVTDAAGGALTKELAHIGFSQLEAMPDDLRRKLLSAGHVYLETGGAVQSAISSNDSMVAAIIPRDSSLFGQAAGLGHYSRTEPALEDLGHSDMGLRMSFHRAMPEHYADEHARLEMQAADSDLRLFLDLGAVEAIALASRPASTLGR